MSAIELSELFPKASACYSTSSDFPEEALEWIPNGLLASLDNGNSEFFAGISMDFPKLYETLTKKCSKITLIETVYRDMSLKNFGRESKNYYWAMRCHENYIFIGIPSTEDNTPIYEKNMTKYLSVLPYEFHAFYQGMNGMSVSKGIGRAGFGLPRKAGTWIKLIDFLDDTYQANCKVNSVTDIFGGVEPGVFIRFSNSDLILCDLNGSVEGLYFFQAELDKCIKLANPVKALDSCFANFVEGKSIDLSSV